MPGEETPDSVPTHLPSPDIISHSVSDKPCPSCGELLALKDGICAMCRPKQADSREPSRKKPPSEEPDPGKISPGSIARKVADGLKEEPPQPFQETFEIQENTGLAPGPVPRVVETARRIRPESVFGKFTLVEKVGVGGAGEVWKAWDKGIDRWVALKFLKNEEEINIQLFRREARMVGRLNHPNIIPIHEMGVFGKHHYIAMQFVEGTTLREFIRRDPHLVAGLVRDAAEALQYAHENDVIHRDIKPTNFLVGEQTSTLPLDSPSRRSGKSYHLYVADFGLAKQVFVASSISRTGHLVGTPAYMSPEQARGENESIDARTDIYSLGATLYELLAGRSPFQGDTVYDLLKRIVEEEAVSVRTHRPEIDRDLDTIVMKCLRKEPENRYSTSGELSEDLQRYLGKEPLKHARPTTFGYLIAKKVRKQPMTWGLGAALLVSIVIGAGFGIDALLERNRIEREGSEKADRAREKANMAVLRATALMDARQALQRGEGSESLLGMLKKAEAETGPDAIWLSEAGRLLYETNDRKMKAEAKGFLEKATELDKERAFEALYYLHLIEDEGKNTHDSRHLQEIRNRAEAIGETNNPFVLIMRCDEAIEAGDYDRALDLADRAVKNGGNIFDTWNHLAMAKSRKGDFGGAIEDHTRAIELNPKYATAWNQRGLAKAEKGDSDGAIKDYNRAIELDPGFFPAWNNRGLVRVAMGDYDGAIKDYSRAIEIDSKYVHAWNNRGIAKEETGDFDGAIEDCSRAIDSILNMSAPGTTAEMPGERKETSTGRSRITPGRLKSIQNM